MKTVTVSPGTAAGSSGWAFVNSIKTNDSAYGYHDGSADPGNLYLSNWNINIPNTATVYGAQLEIKGELNANNAGTVTPYVSLVDKKIRLEWGLTQDGVSLWAPEVKTQTFSYVMESHTLSPDIVDGDNNSTPFWTGDTVGNLAAVDGAYAEIVNPHSSAPANLRGYYTQAAPGGSNYIQTTKRAWVMSPNSGVFGFDNLNNQNATNTFTLFETTVIFSGYSSPLLSEVHPISGQNTKTFRVDKMEATLQFLKRETGIQFYGSSSYRFGLPIQMGSMFNHSAFGLLARVPRELADEDLNAVKRSLEYVKLKLWYDDPLYFDTVTSDGCGGNASFVFKTT